MGIGFCVDHDDGTENEDSDAYWAYSGFHRFRKKLAAEIGILNLESMEGYGGSGSWDSVPSDIIPLLNHSDCEGDISPQDCKRVAPMLRKHIQSWDDGDYDKKMGLALVETMERCAEEDRKLIFC